MAGTAHLAAALRGDGPRALTTSLFDICICSFRFHFVFGIYTPHFISSNLIYSFYCVQNTTSGYGHLHPVPGWRNVQSDFYTVQPTIFPSAFAKHFYAFLLSKARIKVAGTFQYLQILLLCESCRPMLPALFLLTETSVTNNGGGHHW